MTWEVDSFWRELEYLERRVRAPAPHAAAHDASWFDDWQARLNRVENVRSALFLSGAVARRLIVERLAGIDLSGVFDILLSACKDVALVWGGSVLLGGAVGGAIGVVGFGVGAVPGAVLGAGAGAQVGAWVLGLLGLKSLIEDLGAAIPQALRHYEAGLRLAWGPVRRWEMDEGRHRAPEELAEGHVVLMIAVLTALTAYLTRGRGDPGAKARVLQEIRESRRLGPKVADWVAANEDALTRHPGLKPREQQVVMSQAKPSGEPPMTPSQLRKSTGRASEEPPPPHHGPEPHSRPEQAKAAATLREHPNHVDGLPFSYKAAPFSRFVRRFKDEFSAAGFDDAQGFMQGSAASGIKHSGEALDARIPILPTDYDIAIVSPKLLQRANDLGIDVLHGPLRSADLAALGLSDAQAALSAASKYERPVNFKIYENAESVYNFDKTIPVSDWLK